MSAARPLTSLLSAGAIAALTLAAPGTALADPGRAGEGSGGGKAAPSAERDDQATKESPRTQKPSKPASQSPAQPGKPAASDQAATSGQPAKPAKPAKAAPRHADAPAQATTAESRPDDPAGNNGTIKVDTVPADAARANRPHPGCAFTVQFFGFDADQSADITFTGQAPTRSSGPLLSLSNHLISTTPADGALEEGHSLVLSAADLGLVGTPTAAKGWHVKVAVDALGAPGGAKQKVFWLDCTSGEAAVEEDTTLDSDVAGEAASDEAGVTPAGSISPTAADQALRVSGNDVAVLSGTATRERTGATVTSEQAASANDVTLVAGDEGSATSVLPSVLPFTGAAGVAAMLAAGLGAVAAGAVALRAGRRRSADTGAELS